MVVDAKLLVVTEDHTQAEDIRNRVGQTFPQLLHIMPNEVRREISRLQPDLVVLHETKDGMGLQLLPYIAREVPDALVVFLTERRDPIRTRDANRSGAFDILFLPDEITALEDVLNRAVKVLQEKNVKRDTTTAFTWGRGNVITFYSGKGGCGRSLIAATLAQTLQLDSTSGVLLVDLNLQYGGLETYMNVNSDRSLYDLTPVLNELNDNHIRSVTVVEPNSQVELLASPADAEIAEQITEEHVERVLRAARLYYDYILVDLPTEMTTLSYTALEEADHLFYVLTPDAPAMRTLGRVLDLFDKIGVDPTDRLELILNRISRDSEISAKDVRQHFPYPVIGELHEDAKKIQQFINRGKPIRKSRKERGLPVFARDIQKLAGVLLGKNADKSAS
jgi:pilus assembly protein CpaE